MKPDTQSRSKLSESLYKELEKQYLDILTPMFDWSKVPSTTPASD